MSAMTFVYLGIMVLLVAADQGSKYYMSIWLRPKGTVELIPGFIRFRYVLNDGAAFSMLRNARWFFVILTAVCIVLCFVALFNARAKERFPAFHSPVIKTAMILLISGGIGNLIDRLFRANGLVIDFIEPTFINFAVFNVADIFVTCGAAILIIYLIVDILFDFRAKGKYVRTGYTR